MTRKVAFILSWEKLFKKRNDKIDNYSSFDLIINKLKQLGFKKNFKIFNIVGTNGKGSVTNYLASSFQKANFKVGIFTSPHIIKPNERIIVNNQMISNQQFFDIAQKCWEFSCFEITYIVALIYFMDQKVDYAFLEAGLGGMHDATKIIAGDYGLVTSIGLDHQEVLGNSQEEIAIQKNGIRNEQMKFYIPSTIGQTLKIFKHGNFQIIENNGLTYKERNRNLAKGILKEFNIEPFFIEPKGRSEIKIHNDLTTIIDVAHNTHGIKASLEYLKYQNISFDQIVIAIKKSKKIPDLTKIFMNKQIWGYQLNDDFHDFQNQDIQIIKDLQDFYQHQQKSTLYIGTFEILKFLGE